MFDLIRSTYQKITLQALTPASEAATSVQPKISSSLKAIQQICIDILKLILIFFLLFFLYYISLWMYDKDYGLVIQPFETSNMGDESDGKPLAALLRFDLQNINDVWNENIDKKGGDGSSSSFSFPNQSIKNEDLEYSISALGSVGLEGSSFSLGNMLFLMKGLSGNRISTISCSLQKRNSTVFAVAILEDRSSSEKIIRIFQAKRVLYHNSSMIDPIPDLINDLAYQISLDISKRRAPQIKDQPKNWHAFEYMTEGRKAYIDYLIMNNSNDIDNASNLTMMAIESEPGWKRSSDQLSNLGFCYLENRDLAKSKNIFLNTTTIDGFNRSLGLGLIYGLEGDYNNSLDELNKSIGLNNHSAIAWYNRGVALTKKKMPKEAIESYERAINLTPNYINALYNKGSALIDHGKHDDAIKAFDEVIRLDKNYFTAWNNKGNALYLKGNYSDAIEAYNMVIEINPAYALAWYNKGLALSQLGYYDRAISAYNESIRLAPNNPKTLNFKGLALAALKNYNGSIECYDKAIDIDSDWAAPYKNKGLALAALKKYNESIKCYDKAINFDSDSSAPYNNKGLALAALKNYNESIKCYDKAIEIDSDWAAPYNNKGEALAALKKYNESTEWFDKAIKLNSSFLEAKSNLANILISQAKYDEAIEALGAFP
jgi:tetratricopeptide (TPR) repeat protein